MIPSTLATYIAVSILCSFSSIVVPLPKHVFHFLSSISSGNFACFASSFTHRETISSRVDGTGWWRFPANAIDLLALPCHLDRIDR